MSSTPEYPQASPQEAYEQNYGDILDTLAAIKYAVQEQHGNGQLKTWDDVSTQNDILEALHNITRILNI